MDQLGHTSGTVIIIQKGLVNTRLCQQMSPIPIYYVKKKLIEKVASFTLYQEQKLFDTIRHGIIFHTSAYVGSYSSSGRQTALLGLRTERLLPSTDREMPKCGHC